jgi:hypothetical protein
MRVHTDTHTYTHIHHTIHTHTRTHTHPSHDTHMHTPGIADVEGVRGQVGEPVLGGRGTRGALRALGRLLLVVIVLSGGCWCLGFVCVGGSGSVKVGVGGGRCG